MKPNPIHSVYAQSFNALFNATNTENLSQEGLSDWIHDKTSSWFGHGVDSSDIESMTKYLAVFEHVIKNPIKENTPFILLKENKEVLQFYTKRGAIIDSFDQELSNEVSNVLTTTTLVNRLIKLLSKIDIQTDDEFEIESVLNHQELKSIYVKASQTSFLGSLYCNYVRPDAIAKNVSLHYDTVKTKAKNPFGSKKSTALEVTKKSLFAGTASMGSAFTALSGLFDIKRNFKLITNASIIFGGVMALKKLIFDSSSISKSVDNYNKSVDKTHFKILDSIEIDSNRFNDYVSELYEAQKQSQESVVSFIELDKKLRVSDNTFLRDTLRNTRVLCSLLVRAMKVQSDYLQHIAKRNEKY